MDTIPPAASSNQYPNPTTEINQYLATNLLTAEQSSAGSTGVDVELSPSTPSYSGSTISTNNPSLYANYIIATIVPTSSATGTYPATSNGAFFNAMI